MFDGVIDDAIAKIEAGFEKLKWLAIANLALSGSLIVYMYFKGKR